MNIFRTLRAVKFLVTGPLILAMLVVINAMTTPGDWWVKWAALGIGIAWIFSLLRVIRAMVLVGGIGGANHVSQEEERRVSHSPYNKRLTAARRNRGGDYFWNVLTSQEGVRP